MKRGSHSKKDHASYLKSIRFDGMTKSERKKWQDIYYKYKLTKLQYETMVMKQNGLCLGCGLVPKKMCVDHDHMTGKVRGLLCSDCNFVLGFAKDKTTTLENLVRYLQLHP